MYTESWKHVFGRAAKERGVGGLSMYEHGTTSQFLISENDTITSTNS